MSWSVEEALWMRSVKLALMPLWIKSVDGVLWTSRSVEVKVVFMIWVCYFLFYGTE